MRQKLGYLNHLRMTRASTFLTLVCSLFAFPPGILGLERFAAASFFDPRSLNETVSPPESLTWAQHCLTSCLRACLQQTDLQLSLALKFLKWDKEEDCAYRCVHTCLSVGVENGGRIWKYQGKWPHTRFLGIQEPASALFSLFNAVSHVLGLLLLFDTRKTIAQANNRQGALSDVIRHVNRVMSMSRLWICAWIGSMVFHSRDNWATERLDYYLGNVAMTWMAYTAVMRVVLSSNTVKWLGIQRLLQMSFFGGILAHMMSGWNRMNYSQNMRVMIALMIANSCAWLSVCISIKQSFVRLFYLSTVLTYAAGALEIFDFPPMFGFLDAHAVWHLTTPYLSWMFYRFLALDALALVEHKQRRDL
uniref:Post-GPI attachment to proteins factor 3 n=1 Tax=Hanusia phi TaxID=3032 RepID=A0A7S0E205_9CRYP|mmetsp:Transcript_13486/g.31045  ORF Transcript_13486/g.31045 Transcript_13486/m.31045 type:complete len:362 (+) Transcript_13486:73-1158(+)